MSFLVISSSLNPESRSAQMARSAYEAIKKQGAEVSWLDLRDYAELPLCDGAEVYKRPEVQKLEKLIQEADGVLMAVAIYNYDVGASAKNLMELISKDAWRDKVIGFLCAAGGVRSYMSVMPFANSFMLDFRCTILPDFVYADPAGDDGGWQTPDVGRRIERLASRLIGFTSALSEVKV